MGLLHKDMAIIIRTEDERESFCNTALLEGFAGSAGSSPRTLTLQLPVIIHITTLSTSFCMRYTNNMDDLDKIKSEVSTVVEASDLFKDYVEFLRRKREHKGVEESV